MKRNKNEIVKNSEQIIQSKARRGPIGMEPLSKLMEATGRLTFINFIPKECQLNNKITVLKVILHLFYSRIQKIHQSVNSLVEKCGPQRARSIILHLL